MAKHKVSELEGALLDAAVAKALGLVSTVTKSLGPAFPVFKTDDMECLVEEFTPSKLWCYGGPIIERERITVVANTGWEDDGPVRWAAWVGPFSHYIDTYPDYADAQGDTPLIAAMRAYVASKLGGEVELPLTNPSCHC